MDPAPIKTPPRSPSACAPRNFQHIETWIFDLDDTLYPASCDLFTQISRRMGEYISKNFDVTAEEARELQIAYYRKFGTTLAGLMQNHKLPPEPFLEYIYDIDVSGVVESPNLRAAISGLPGRRVVFTNGSRRHAERIINRLGVADLFAEVCDIADLEYVPKPAPQAYHRLLKLHAIQAQKAAMFEDLPHNLEVAHSLGMTTVLVCPDKIDHPARVKIENWHELPSYIDHVTEEISAFLSAKTIAQNSPPKIPV